MTPERLDQIQRRADKAHPGPWVYEQMDGRIENEDGDRRELWWDHFHDDIFIANARTDVPDLVAEVRRLQDENAELRRFRAAVGHMEQELNVLRSREMDADDIADYSEDRAKLKAETDQLKLAKAELVEALKQTRTTLMITQGNVRSAMKRDAVAHSAWEGVPEQIQERINNADAAIAKHGETNE